MAIDILVIIVNYKTPELTIQCLESLSGQIGSNRAIVVENFSQDDSADKIAKAIHEHGWGWASVMQLHENKGFAAGNNAAISAALGWAEPPRYLHLLNPDTIAQPNAIQSLADFLDAHPKAGIAGSLMQNKDGSPQHGAFRFPNIINEFDHGLRLGIVHRRLLKWFVPLDITPAPSQADWVSGASLMARREVFESCGLMDEGYFLYFEEVDFCFQAKRAGWECWFVPESKIIHLVGQSTGLDRIDEVPKRRPQYWFASRRRYLVKNYGRAAAIAFDLVWMFTFSLWRVRRFIQNKTDTDPPHLLWDFFKNSSLFNS